MTNTDSTTPLRARVMHGRSGCVRPGDLAPLMSGDRAREIVASLTTAFPDGELTVHWDAETDDRLTIGGRFEGTHVGPWRGVPGTGHRVSALAIMSLTVTDGMVSDINSVVDSLAIAEQLGVVVPLEPPACRRPIPPEANTGASAC